MLNKPRCQKAQNIPGKQAIYCEGKFLCAHQYHCPQTRQYENTAEFSKCKRLPQKEAAKPQTAPVKFVVNVVPKKPDVPIVEVAPPTIPADYSLSEAIETASEAMPTPIYTKNVSPIDYGVTRTEEAPAEPVDTNPETGTNKEVRKESKNGTVRNTRRRTRKKG